MLVVRSFPTLQAPLPIEFSRQEYWSVWPFFYAGDLSDPGMEAESPTLQADSLPFELPGKHISGRGADISSFLSFFFLPTLPLSLPLPLLFSTLSQLHPTKDICVRLPPSSILVNYLYCREFSPPFKLFVETGMPLGS